MQCLRPMDITTLIAFTILLAASIYVGVLLGRRLAAHDWKEKVREAREDAIKRSRAVLSGQFSEQLAPYLPDFHHKPTEARFIGKPIDFIVFKGMDEKQITDVVFVEVKSGNAKLSTHERRLRDAIDAKRVSWEEYRIPAALTGQREQTPEG